MLGEQLILWTIRLSMLGYGIFLIASLGGWDFRARRRLWVLAWMAFGGHVLAAFHYDHQWSHAHAVADTARQTKEMLGWEFGAGIYFSYLFFVVWTVDVLWICVAQKSYGARSRRLANCIHLYIFFIAFNGTIVFESGPIRWAAVAVCVVLIVLFTKRGIRESMSVRAD